MISRGRFTAVLFAILVGTAGCATVLQGEEVDVSMYAFEDDRESDTAFNPITVSDGTVQVDGYLTVEGGIAEREVYSDVSVRAYDSEARLICLRSAGDLPATDTRNVSLELDTIPRYVILYSPDFWTEEIRVDYYRYDDESGQFTPERAASESELPVEVSAESSPEC